MAIRFYASDDVSAVEPVECEQVGYPHKDANGRTQFINTHFDTEEEAWAKLEASGAAGVSLSNSEIVRLKRRLRSMLRELARDVERNEKIRRGAAKFREEARRLDAAEMAGP